MPVKRRTAAPKGDSVLESLQGDFKLFLQALWGQLDLPEPTIRS
jgi:hypothetical protein